MTVIEEKKNKIIFELGDQTHTFCNILKKELLNDDHVKVASYSVQHPLVGKPRFILETDGADPKKVLQSAANRMTKTADN